MNIPTPAELRAKREVLGLKQVEVAKMAGISQSMVARIEAGSVDPRMGTLSKIVDVLNAAERSTASAADVMHAPVYSVRPGDPLIKAVGIMEEMGISQLPVIEDHVHVGCISESAIIAAMEESGVRKPHIKHVKDLTLNQKFNGSCRFSVSDIMEPGFPTVPPNTSISTLVHILRENHAVIVLNRGKVEGVITKHDLIHLIL